MVRVDGQHREAVQGLALGVFPPGPQTGDAQRIAVGVADAGGFSELEIAELQAAEVIRQH
jgi:hypothetical protein